MGKEVEEIQNIHEQAQEGIKYLAAEFKFGKELQEKIANVREETKKDQIGDAIKGAHVMLRIYKWVARGERRTDHSNEHLVKLLDEIGKILPKEHKDKEEHFKDQLIIASRTLKKLASFYRGDIKHEINDLEDHERLLLKLEKNSKDEDATKVKKALEEDLTSLEKDVVELNKWISANTLIVKLINQWAEELARISSA